MKQSQAEIFFGGGGRLTKPLSAGTRGERCKQKIRGVKKSLWTEKPWFVKLVLRFAGYEPGAEYCEGIGSESNNIFTITGKLKWVVIHCVTK